ncbi:MAG TPA: patatin-like phospholipase family protein [Solirubrobacteraceae bacterium]|nr:patatin-like phospholipase family protein [Solirubrobacteraceae bacterium]
MEARVYRRAVVLGGGGLTGAAWLTGVLAAFEAARIPLGTADLVLGTSAGSVVGTQVVGGRSFAKQYRFLGAERVPARELLVRLYRAAPKPSPDVLEQLGAQLLDAPTSTEASRAIEGRAALAADTMPWPVWVALVALYLRRLRWPSPALAITAVDAQSGRLRVFRASDRVHVAQAVAASSAVPQFFPPVRIQGGRYMDGGTRSVTNADLAAAYDLVLLFIDHRALPGGMGPLSRAALDAEIEGLRAGGATVIEVSPDDASPGRARRPRGAGPQPARAVGAGRAGAGRGRGGAGRGGAGGMRVTVGAESCARTL